MCTLQDIYLHRIRRYNHKNIKHNYYSQRIVVKLSTHLTTLDYLRFAIAEDIIIILDTYICIVYFLHWNNMLCSSMRSEQWVVTAKMHNSVHNVTLHDLENGYRYLISAVKKNIFY